jgi:membrane-anchored glycerophosphoryl diester phosphodiesterase (GDPDase)
MLNECFLLLFTHWINFKLIHMLPCFIKNKTIKTNITISTSNKIELLNGKIFLKLCFMNHIFCLI